MFNSFEKMPLKYLVILNLFIVILLGYADFLTGTEFAFAIFYCLPIMIVAWHANLRIGIIFALLCTFAWFLADWLGGDIYSTDLFLIWKALVRLLLFTVIVIITNNFRRSSDEALKHKLVSQKSYYIINTSQQLTAIIIDKISQHNSELLNWIAKQKANGRNVSTTVEETGRNIGLSLRTLSEICFSYSPTNSHIDLENFINDFHVKIATTKNKINNRQRNVQTMTDFLTNHRS